MALRQCFLLSSKWLVNLSHHFYNTPNSVPEIQTSQKMNLHKLWEWIKKTKHVLSFYLTEKFCGKLNSGYYCVTIILKLQTLQHRYLDPVVWQVTAGMLRGAGVGLYGRLQAGRPAVRFPAGARESFLFSKSYRTEPRTSGYWEWSDQGTRSTTHFQLAPKLTMSAALPIRLLYVFSLDKLFNFLPLSGMLRLENINTTRVQKRF
jgi:hypothetical protein